MRSRFVLPYSSCAFGGVDLVLAVLARFFVFDVSLTCRASVFCLHLGDLPDGWGSITVISE